MSYHIIKSLIACLALFPAIAYAEEAAPHCQRESVYEETFVICRFEQTADLRTFLNAPDGEPFGHFGRLKETLNEGGETLIFAMNGGMYHEDRTPVGLYIEDGNKTQNLMTRAGPGNFGLLPNGVFYVDGAGAHVAESLTYQALNPDTFYATQSGPMLVIEGVYHPALNPNGTSLKRRNGVGVNEETGEVAFVISDGFVNFYTFARVFRDHLHMPNALYLDGTISRLYAPEIDRNEGGLRMGPIIGVVGELTENSD
ncbi:phosphodiester glycosidase family protein [Ponticaulis sp.]|uniref:phosphodiester glycosidase family protein n=1 Tax=Ponticaulis sp. TaxID=2020902 RepID=UPI000B6FFBA4|nr:phosphodiester glycosidase family protein [Ponticaulis sp.]MAI91670.1 hypothetical protein [Ponticaulis sp.]OUX97235.1 MAG: hypothetical protein CBB65_14610 [Hyphomonadaceae bacterium TMED5]|tara:strand:+ start:66252 stop:67019 length:768 start_codon:yes stop_codon:yes gene_type:complete